MSDIVLVYSDRDSHKHWMNNRLFKRGGFVSEEFDYAYAWQPDLFKVLREHKVAVAMGLIPLRAMLGETQPWRWMCKHTRHQTGCIVVGGMDPMRLLPNRSEDEDEELRDEVTRSPARYTAALAWALRKAKILAKDPTRYTVECDYLYDPSPEEFKKWADKALISGAPYLSWDIETPYKSAKDEEEYEQARLQEDLTVVRISFSYKAGDAVSIPWDAPYLEDIKRLFANFHGYHVGWNSYSFDIPYLTKKGYTFGGPCIDGMDAWHWLQSDLDRGLEHVSGYFTDILPWKHLSKSNPAHYSCIDADAALRNTEAIVECIKESGKWESYETASIKLMMPVLFKAGQRGAHIDVHKQQALRAELTALQEQTLVEIQQFVPDEVKRYKFYMRKPSEETFTQGVWREVASVKEERFCSSCGKPNVSVKHPCVKSGEGRVEKRVVPATAWIQVEPPAGKVKLWVKDNGFNPNSADQLRNYIRRNGHPLGKNHKNKNPEESVDVLHLKKLARKFGDKFPVYPLFIKSNQITKALSQYVDGFAPDEQEYVHTTYTNVPSSWRLSSQNVNTQNVSKRAANPFAKKARATITASPGRVLLQADSSAIEAVKTGWFMQNQRYIDLARRGVHSYLVCMYRGWPFDDEHIKKAKVDEYYDMMKRTVHMSNYKGGYKLLFHNYEEDFKTLKNAKTCQDFLFQAIPELDAWQHSVMYRAQKECFLESPWGHKHYFYDVFSYRLSPNGKLMYNGDGSPMIRYGKDAKRVVSYLPQHSAAMFHRENLVLIGESEFGQWMPAHCANHDGYVLDIPERHVERAQQFLIDVLTRPIPQMGGLQIGCAIEVGENWGSYSESNPQGMREVMVVKV